jgi:hypothetical protein
VVLVAAFVFALSSRHEQVFRSVARRLQAQPERVESRALPGLAGEEFASGSIALEAVPLPRSEAGAPLAPLPPRPSPRPARSPATPGTTPAGRTSAPTTSGSASAAPPQAAVAAAAAPARGVAPEPAPPAFEFNRIAPDVPSFSDAEPPAGDGGEEVPDASPLPVPPAPAAGAALAGYAGTPAPGEGEGEPSDEPPDGQSAAASGARGEFRPPAREQQPEPRGPVRITLAPLGDAVTGQNVRVAVRIDTAVDVTSTPFSLHYDPALLRFVRVLAGDFLSRSGTAPLLLASAAGEGGEVAVGLSLPGTGAGVSGSGTLLVLEFLGLAPGTSPLLFANSSVLNSRRRELPAEFVPATIVVH